MNEYKICINHTIIAESQTFVSGDTVDFEQDQSLGTSCDGRGACISIARGSSCSTNCTNSSGS